MNNTPTLEGGHNDGAAKKLPEPNEKGSAAATTEPMNDNHAGKPESITQGKSITAPTPVDSEASITGASPSPPLAPDDLTFDDVDNDQLIVDQVLSEGGTIDEAHEILENLNCYGSRHEPGGSADVESDGLEYLRAVCGQHCES